MQYRVTVRDKITSLPDCMAPYLKKPRTCSQALNKVRKILINKMSGLVNAVRGINKTGAFTGKPFSVGKAPNFPFPPRNFPFFYGWVILLASVVGTVMSIPGQTMGVGVFTDFLITATGLDRLGISTAYMVGTIGSSLLLPFSGQLLDKRGARFLIVLSSLGLGFSLVLLGRVESILQTIISTRDRVGDPVAAFVLMSVTFLLMRQFGQGLMTLSSRNMLSKWFDRKRGLAVGIAGKFISFGFSESPLFLNLLIIRSDWQSVCFQLAVIIGVGMTIFGWVFFRDNPEECGLLLVKVMALFIGTLSILNLDLLIGKIGLVVGFGMSGGLFGCLASVAWPRYFGRKYLGAISSLNMATMVFASAIGPALFGMSLSFTNTYSLAVWISAALPLMILLCSQRVKNHG